MIPPLTCGTHFSLLEDRSHVDTACVPGSVRCKIGLVDVENTRTRTRKVCKKCFAKSMLTCMRRIQRHAFLMAQRSFRSFMIVTKTNMINKWLNFLHVDKLIVD